MNSYYTKIMLCISLALLAGGCAGGGVLPLPNTDKPDIVACSQEAKICPDGSTVGRGGPQCDFAACPAAATPPEPTPLPPPSISSGIEGVITIGPTCPVVQYPSETNCEDRPYETTVLVKTADGKTQVANFTSDKNGRFKWNLSPGSYLLVPVNGKVYPRVNEQEVLVEKNRFTHVTIQYDSGIR